MDEEGINPTEFSRRMGLAPQSVYPLLDGKQALTPETAYRLELVTGVPASFWNALETNYKLALLKERKAGEEARMKAWIQSFPVSDLSKRGALPPDFAKAEILVQHETLLRFFGVANEEAYGNTFNSNLFAARTVRGLKSDEPAIMAWLQLGRREAENLTLPPYDQTRFEALLADLPRQTQSLASPATDVGDWLLRLKHQCRDAGVALVFVRPLTGVRHVAGAAHWLKDTPVIQLSLHGKSIDRILFSFCHEAAHILNQKRSLFYVTADSGDSTEKEADGKAASTLLPNVTDRQLLATGGFPSSLDRIARSAHVYPGIVYGRYCKLVNYSGRSVKLLPSIRKFEWAGKTDWKFA
jgi:plasmid maintenance system antidote protein VapI